MKHVASISAVMLAAACASPRAAGLAPSFPLVGTDGAEVDLHSVLAHAPLTVLIFFSPECHCLTAHEPRIRALADAYRSKGVQFFWVDSERRASPAADAREARQRGFAFPILLDAHARVADWAGAEYATFAVVLDRRGAAHYRGGIDSDKRHLHPDATPYLRNALDDLVAGREPALAEADTLGCALQKW